MQNITARDSHLHVCGVLYTIEHRGRGRAAGGRDEREQPAILARDCAPVLIARVRQCIHAKRDRFSRRRGRKYPAFVRAPVTIYTRSFVCTCVQDEFREARRQIGLVVAMKLSRGQCTDTHSNRDAIDLSRCSACCAFPGLYRIASASSAGVFCPVKFCESILFRVQVDWRPRQMCTLSSII